MFNHTFSAQSVLKKKFLHTEMFITVDGGDLNLIYMILESYNSSSPSHCG